MEGGLCSTLCLLREMFAILCVLSQFVRLALLTGDSGWSAGMTLMVNPVGSEDLLENTISRSSNIMIPGNFRILAIVDNV